MPGSLKIENEKETGHVNKKLRQTNTKKMLKTNTLTTFIPCNTDSNVSDAIFEGKFGWETIQNCNFPYFIVSSVKFVSVRIVSEVLLKDFQRYFTDEVFSCLQIRGNFLSQNEAELLNEINFKHCDGAFGKIKFSTADYKITLDDFHHVYEFLKFCHQVLILRANPDDNRCGFVRINSDSFVPYIEFESRKRVPLFYFEGDSKYLEDKCVKLTGWPMTYLRFCCKVQRINRNFYETDACDFVDLDEVMKLFPPGAEFRTCDVEHWPGISNTDHMRRCVQMCTSRQRSNGQKTVAAKKNEQQKQFALVPLPTGVFKIIPANDQQTGQDRVISSVAKNNVVSAPQSGYSVVKYGGLKIQSGGVPYQLVKTIVDGKYATCVNMKLSTTNTLIISVGHVRSIFFEKKSPVVIYEGLKWMGVEFYTLTDEQKHVLSDIDKRKLVNKDDVFVLFNKFITVFPQVKYIINNK